MNTTKSTTYPHPGQTKFDSVAPDERVADQIACAYYSDADIVAANDQSGAYWAIRSGGAFVGMVGRINGRNAILIKKADGGRTLHIMEPTEPTVGAIVTGISCRTGRAVTGKVVDVRECISGTKVDVSDGIITVPCDLATITRH